jgi:hypothetical protein
MVATRSAGEEVTLGRWNDEEDEDLESIAGMVFVSVTAKRRKSEKCGRRRGKAAQEMAFPRDRKWQSVQIPGGKNAS